MKKCVGKSYTWGGGNQRVACRAISASAELLLVCIFEATVGGGRLVLLQCSFSVCLRNREESYKAVERYVDEWRAKKQQPFRCYYDTISLDTVIVRVDTVVIWD